MSSLWTPGGERPVRREQPEAQTSPPGGPAAGRGAVAGGEPSPEEAAAELARLEAQLLGVPAGDVVANHCYGLFELAALHLSQQPPNFEQARIAIDALGAVVEQLGERLGEGAPALREGLSQIRLAFVQLSGAPTSGPDAPGTTAPQAGPGEDAAASGEAN
ncbi:MAG: hypothetical protein M0004_10165 [Actinomycetota bacterium]|nr:hypothetical protein [Actinomycetota bacterium]